MQILHAAPPITPTRKLDAPRRDYSAIFNALESNPTTWIAVDPADVGGDTTTEKQGRLHASARGRGLKIQVTAQGGLIYIRLRPIAFPEYEELCASLYGESQPGLASPDYPAWAAANPRLVEEDIIDDISEEG